MKKDELIALVLEQLKSSKEEGKRPAQDEVFETIILQWSENVKLRVKESSYVKYMNLVKNHILSELGEIKVSDLTTEIIEQFVQEKLSDGKRSGGGLSEKTVKDILNILRDIHRYAAYRNIEIPYRLETIRLRCFEPEIRILDKGEQEILEQVLLNDQSLTSTGILLSLFMGLRLGEVCALQRKHILYNERLLQVRATMQRIQNLDEGAAKKTKVIVTEPKTSCSIRDIPIPQALLERLNVLREMPEHTYILTGKQESFIEPRCMENIFKRYLAGCGLEMVNFHVLRHTFATRCVENGFDIKALSEILGHASVNITLNKYVHSSMEQKRKYMDQMFL